MAKINRRDFFKMVGVTGTAGLTACDATVPVETVIPYVVQPDDITPGVPTFFATIASDVGAPYSVLVRNREGRVVHVGGNADSPAGRGGTSARAIAEVQEVYDADRFRGPQGGGSPGAWDELLGQVAGAVKAAGSRVAWLGRYRGGSLGALIADVAAATGGQAVHWESFGHESLAGAVKRAFGTRGLPRYQVDDARTIVSFGADFLHTWLAPVDHSRGWAAARSPKRNHHVAPFYAITPRLSNTGLNADTWYAPVPGGEAHIARALAKLVAERTKSAAFSAYLSAVDAHASADVGGVAFEKLEALADLLADGPSVVFPGGADGASANGGELALATLVLNTVAGNLGKTVSISGGTDLGTVSSYSDVAGLLDSCKSGATKVLFLDGLDPVFSLPPSLGAAEALAKVETVVVFANLPIEGAPAGAIYLPPGSTIEQWGDAMPYPGVGLLQQPGMNPLHDTRGVGDALLAIAQGAALVVPAIEDEGEEAIEAPADDEAEVPVVPTLDGAELVASFASPSFQHYIASRWYAHYGADTADWNGWWNAALARGGHWVDASTDEPAPTSVAAAELAAPGGTVVLFPHSMLFDGRGANKPWLQEVADPSSGYTWGSWAELSPHHAEKLGLTEKSTVKVTANGASVEVGVRISKGIRDDVVGVVVGNGHTVGNRYSVGFGQNTWRLAGGNVDAASGALVLAGLEGSASAGTGENPHRQMKGSEDMDGRPVALTSYVDDVLHADEHAAPGSLAATINVPEDPRLVEAGIHDFFPEPEHPTYRFAMSVDLDACSGCGACEVACYAENNIPVVGPVQQGRNRSLGWIRLDRFWVGEGEHPDVRFIPVMCQHCSHAPCEGVCPVVATYHNLDGLNAMIYNRCVGTRYCANNCPYSARRFNYHTFRWPESYELMLNPDVATREMGVMEKCTFCIQRLRRAKAPYRHGGTATDAELVKVTACADACPSDAITFGNLKDASSTVHADFQDPRAYVLFKSLNTKPGVRYKTRISFTEPAADAHHGGGHHG